MDERQVIRERMQSSPFGERPDTNCGAGSTLLRTESIRNVLPSLVEKYGPRVNDAGCGDGRWITKVGIKDYAGYDIVRYDEWGENQQVLDITLDKMRDCDLIICRDVLIHLPSNLIKDALKLFGQAGKYLLAPSYFDNQNNNCVIEKTDHRVDLSVGPFNLGEPVWQMDDKENGSTRYLGVWTLAAET